ncbi:unnamed protein product [Rhizophagus irregularis]|nr:unnamed protein product [Rhizophagus irregularis]
MRCHGITKFESESHDNNINYMLVMEYADGGSLRDYLMNNFGLREAFIPDTPDDYIKIYTKCWDDEPNVRPTIFQLMK